MEEECKTCIHCRMFNYYVWSVGVSALILGTIIGRVFIVVCGQIQYSVGTDGLQKKTKYSGRIIPNKFFVEV